MGHKTVCYWCDWEREIVRDGHMFCFDYEQKLSQKKSKVSNLILVFDWIQTWLEVI